MKRANIYTISPGNKIARRKYMPHYNIENIGFNFNLASSCDYTPLGKHRYPNRIFGVSFGDADRNSISLGWMSKPSMKKGYSAGSKYYSLHLEVLNNGGIEAIPLMNRSYGKIYHCDFIFDKKNNKIIIRMVSQRVVRIFMVDFIFPKRKLGRFLYPKFQDGKYPTHTMMLKLNI